MFETLSPPEADSILRLTAMFAADDRPHKVDLGVGVYRAPDGRTPVMAAVKSAERRILATQTTKGYVGLSGDPAFLEAMRTLILGDAIDPARVAACATPGGTGAVRQVFEMAGRLAPGAAIWLPAPTWPNHSAIARHLDLTRRAYRYHDPATGDIDRDGMLSDLRETGHGDLVLLHACCHNPTGADLRLEDWRAIAGILNETGAIPFIDMAYLGFADGPEADAAGTRLMATAVPETLIAASCSKNFGLYRDRVGIVLAITGNGAARAAVDGMLAHLNRQNYAFPPDHGARVVETILSDAVLTDAWHDELRRMRLGMLENRRALVAALGAETGSDRFGFLARHRGMFSLIGAAPDRVETLREKHAIYLVGDGRMNVAGLTPDTIPRVARALAEVLAEAPTGM